MNLHELPMIFFTVMAQMSVGAFLVLGVIQTFGSLRHDSKTIDRVADPALYAIGPTLVLGLIASMFHMNDVFHVLNVFRGWKSSWLSREIIFGMGFAGLGFLFALMQWFKWGSARLRQVVAAITALVGVGLLVVMSMIYYSLRTVPAWHSWFTPAQFIITAVLLGSLAVGTAFMLTTVFGQNKKKVDIDTTTEAADDGTVNSLVASSLKGIAVTVIVAGSALLVMMPIYLQGLAQEGEIGALSLEAYSGALFVVRLALIALGAGLLAIFIYGFAKPHTNPTPLTVCVAVALVLVFVGELLGRMQFYEAMVRIGM